MYKVYVCKFDLRKPKIIRFSEDFSDSFIIFSSQVSCCFPNAPLYAVNRLSKPTRHFERDINFKILILYL